MNQISNIDISSRDVRTYGNLALSKDQKKWIISEVEPHVSIRLKQIFSRIPKEEVGQFKLVRDTAIDFDLKWFLYRYPLRMTKRDAEILESGRLEFLDAQMDMERILLPQYEPPAFIGLQPGQVVRHYQAQPIEIAHRSRGLLLVDPCGAGKTYTGAAFCLEKEHLPAAVVCQGHIQSQWKDKVESFTTLRVHMITKTTPYDLPEADIYLFRYTQLNGWVDIFEKKIFKSVIYDEPQELRRGTDSQKGAAAKVLSRNATWRIGLTGTPIYGYGAEIHNVMSFINDKVLGSRDEFLREWCVGNQKPLLRDAKALGTYLRDSYAFLRRTKAEIGREMPPVSKIVESVPYDDEAVRDIEQLARELAIKATTGSFIERGNAARDLDIMVRQATGVAKAKYVAAYVRILVESGEPVLLMGWHRACYDIWLSELSDLSPLMYTGSESPSQKKKTINDFKDGKSKLLIMSLRSAAGIDGLQHYCSTIVFGEIDWSENAMHQCIERLSREGQPDPVTAIFLVADAGSDPPMIEMIGLKASEARQVVDPNLGVEEIHSDRTRIKMLVEQYLEKKQKVNLEDVVSLADEGQLDPP